MKLMYDVHDAIEIVFSDLITIRENLFFKSTHVSMGRPYLFASQDSLGNPYPHRMSSDLDVILSLFFPMDSVQNQALHGVCNNSPAALFSAQ